MEPSIGVSDYYAGKSIFVTGATGFIGKVLIEKLLRCCPEINKIYLLMRAKKGQGTKERLDDFINCRVFDKLQALSPKVFDKLCVIAGDILQEDLGISIQDWDMLQRDCQLILHCAACVRFDMFIREAFNMNTVGTLKVLKLAEGMKKLEAFIHVSTSYCRCELPVLEERLYPSRHRPQNVMDCVKWMDNDLLEYLEPKLIEPQPNTYAYTKSLTEDLVSQYAGKFPICIARPSIVIAAYKEPMPGWVDNMNGPTGLIIGTGKGVIRTMHCNVTYQGDLVPVDMVVNGCILLAYLTAIEKPKEVRVCNITLSGINPITWQEALEMGRVHLQEFPFSVCLWYPGGTAKTSRVQHLIAAFFVHVLPAYFVDLIMFLMGKKTFMVKIQKRVHYGLEVLQYYHSKEWYFKNDYFMSLRNKVSKKDNETFYTDIESVNWNTCMRNYMKGAREYCCKEDPATLPQARKLQRQLYYLDKAVQIIIYSVCAYFIYYYVIRIFI